MAILIDPPVWPAHGTVWSHLITDSHLDELHAFARQLNIPRRGFDIDHYDVPAALYEHALALGARAVSAKEVVHALRSAGLRVKTADRATVRPAQRLYYLHAEWRQLGDSLSLTGAAASSDSAGATSDRWLNLGESLLDRWGEAHRSYHDVQHLEDVLLSLNQLDVRGEKIAAETLLAAWFHDAVYLGETGNDERASAELAVASLTLFDLSPAFTQSVGDMIMATIPAQHVEVAPTPLRHLLDADLAIFAASPTRYTEYTDAVRNEYAHVADADFASGRIQILESYASQATIYRTHAARALWEERARENLEREIVDLRLSIGSFE